MNTRVTAPTQFNWVVMGDWETGRHPDGAGHLVRQALEAVQRGQIRHLEEVQEKLEDPQGTFWDTVCVPILDAVPARELAAETGIAESLLIRYRKGLVKPKGANLRRLVGSLRGKTSLLLPSALARLATPT